MSRVIREKHGLAASAFVRILPLECVPEFFHGICSKGVFRDLM